MVDSLQVGLVAKTQSLAQQQAYPLKGSNGGDLITSAGAGRYYEPTYQRQMFTGANQAGVVTTVGLATTYTGLVLSNPITSTVNLVINKVGVAFLVAFPAAAAVGLMVGYNPNTNVTHSVAGVTHSNYWGPSIVTAQGLVDTGATLPTAPFVTHIFEAGLTGAITTEAAVSADLYDLEGSVILGPGAYAAIYTSTVSGAASMFASFQWEEKTI